MVPGMTDLTIHTTDSAPEASREALQALERNVGFVPNLAATIAGSPVAMAGFVAMQSSLRRSELTPIEREVVGVAVSRANECGYSVAAHSTFAAAQGAAPEVIDALRSGDELPDAKLEELRGFAERLVETRGHAEPPAGFSAQIVLEVVAQVAYTTLANLVANVAETPIDPAFEPVTTP
jgi:AhpD family alkylhydroperoxidase